MKFISKVALITGSASNIGRSIALKSAQEGANVVVHTKTNIEGGKEVTREIKAYGGTAVIIQADLTEPQKVESLFKQTLGHFGTLDILVNNAGSKARIGRVERSVLDLT